MLKKKVIVVISLRKVYNIDGATVEALNGIDLEVTEGEFITISGPSGSGKTTFLNLIGGLDRPTSGKIEVFGHDLTQFDEEFLATFRCTYVGYVFQSYNLISTLTTIENIAFPMQMAKWDQEHIEERSRRLLELVELEDRANHFPSQLSGGELQRAAFARALANDPPLLLVDEPTGNLDLHTGLKIIGILQSLKQNKTVIVVTHDQGILSIADRTLTLADGRIVES
jgi:putative ABC transport system ATP-binding protein